MKKWLKIGAAVYVGTTGAAYFLFRPKDQAAKSKKDYSRPLNEEERRVIFDSNASHYDDDIDKHEKWAGIKSLREQLCSQVGGGASVLEVGAGTCRNLAYYPAGTRLVAADFSASMLDLGRKRAATLKWEDAAPGAAAADAESSAKALIASPSTGPERRAVFLLHNQSAGIPFPNGSFDAVIDTFGLCSYEDPVAVLREMRRVCKPKEEGGKGILLLEHGKSSWQWLSSLLDKNTGGHVHKHGCYWNRDIEGLVREAGLTIETVHRRHGGTTYYIIAR